jgi:hypothetical protein
MIRKLESQYVPARWKRTITSHKPIWMTCGALRAARKKYRLYAKYKGKNHPADVRAVAQAKKSIKSAKLNLERKLADSIRSDNKSFFAYAWSTRKSKPTIGPIIDSVGDLVTQMGSVVEVLNKHYSTVFTVDNPNSTAQPEQSFNMADGELLTNLTVEPEAIRKKLDKAWYR